jgi:hypothetical protein
MYSFCKRDRFIAMRQILPLFIKWSSLQKTVSYAKKVLQNKHLGLIIFNFLKVNLLFL